MRILLLEDDDDLARRLAEVLRRAGFTVDRAADGDTGWYLGAHTAYDAMVLDLGLPALPGLEVLRRWRAAARTSPVLILSARASWSERVEGLNAGADDYLGKPFQPEEVVARLRALIRRAAQSASPVLVCGDLSLDTTGPVATRAGATLELTALELKILGWLMLRQGRIVSQGEIMDHVYPVHEAHQPNAIEAHIARLRKKIGHDAIRTVRGLGYRMG